MIVEDTWGMMIWLHQFFEENSFEWERRKQLEVEGKLKYEKWRDMEQGELIELLKREEASKKVESETKKERAIRRRSYWKEWRQVEHREEREKDVVVDKLEMRKQMLAEIRTKRLTWWKNKAARKELKEGDDQDDTEDARSAENPENMENESENVETKLKNDQYNTKITTKTEKINEKTAEKPPKNIP